LLRRIADSFHAWPFWSAGVQIYTFLQVADTQALHLARRGFTVTATDISEAAIRLAIEKAQKEGFEITWEQDDILDTQLDRQFDFIFDRGLFHVLAPERRGIMSG
jgi:chemotaxis methyl-accepting protein methylase